MRTSSVSTLLILCLSLVLVRPAHAFTLYLASGGATTGDQNVAAEALIKAFKAEHPDSSIELDVSMSYLRGVTETLMQNFGNRTPDVAIVGLVEWPILYKHKMLRRLDSVLSARDLAQIWKGFLPESTVQRYGKTVDAKAFVLPFNRGTPALYINSGLLPDLATEANSGKLTWKELGENLDTAQAQRRDIKETLHVVIPRDDWVTEAVLEGATGAPTLSGQSTSFGLPVVQALMAELARLRDAGQLKIVDSEHDAYEAFISGKSVAALISTSAYNSVAKRTKFDFQIVPVPHFGKRVVNTGGGDLVMPDSPGHPLSEKDKRDIRAFILWFYGGKGAAQWARDASMSPLVKAAAESPLFKSAAAMRPDQARMLRNAAKWTVTSFYQLDEFCDILKLRQTASKTFEDALVSHEPELILKQADTYLGKIMADPQCP